MHASMAMTRGVSYAIWTTCSAAWPQVPNPVDGALRLSRRGNADEAVQIDANRGAPRIHSRILSTRTLGSVIVQ